MTLWCQVLMLNVSNRPLRDRRVSLVACLSCFQVFCYMPFFFFSCSSSLISFAILSDYRRRWKRKWFFSLSEKGDGWTVIKNKHNLLAWSRIICMLQILFIRFERGCIIGILFGYGDRYGGNIFIIYGVRVFLFSSERDFLKPYPPYCNMPQRRLKMDLMPKTVVNYRFWQLHCIRRQIWKIAYVIWLTIFLFI